ncbi:hypothetical protein ACLMAB_15450 [Brevibacillus laterosporus]
MLQWDWYNILIEEAEIERLISWLCGGTRGDLPYGYEETLDS